MNSVARRLGAVVAAVPLLAAILSTVSCRKNPAEEEVSRTDDYQQAYAYAFPMISFYKVMYQSTIDKTGPQYKGPFNTVLNSDQVFTPKDTTVVTPDIDTLPSMMVADVRAEPLVFCVPDVPNNRYYFVQLTDMYTSNFGYVGTRTTFDNAGCYMVTGPGWKGAKPPGVNWVFVSETQFNMLTYRTQLLNPADVDNVKKIQAGYTARPLSAFLHQPAPPPPPPVDFPKFTDDAFSTDFPKYLNFLMQFGPEVRQEATTRMLFSQINIGPGEPFDFAKLSDMRKADLSQAAKDGCQAIQNRRDGLGRNVNGWKLAEPFGPRDYYHMDYVFRAAAAMFNLFGTDADEGVYPAAKTDAIGAPLDGSKHNYTLTFAANKFPPVSAFWSVTMYDGKTQLLVENPINRYLINSMMLPDLKKNSDGALTIYIQKDPPPPDKKANWLPAPNGPIYVVMRLYWPRKAPPSILPVGAGAWDPPAILTTQ
jgi:hypothetical protein